MPRNPINMIKATGHAPIVFLSLQSVCEDCGKVTQSADQYEVFGTSVEEAVREMRFRIQQKTRLTASAGQSDIYVPSENLKWNWTAEWGSFPRQPLPLNIIAI